MPAPDLIYELESTRNFFNTTLSVFEAPDAAFVPHAGMFSVAGQVAHVGDTIDWFIVGAFGPGWDMDFDAGVARAKAVTSLEDARAMMLASFDKAIAVVSAATDDELNAPIPNDTIMNGAPRRSVINAIVDHTAHHRGALSVYARLLGKVPMMPYA